METDIMIESISKTVFCALKQALKISDFKNYHNYIELDYPVSQNFSENKLFGILKVDASHKDSLKLGMFLQAFLMLLEKENIKAKIEKQDNLYKVYIFKPSRLVEESSGGLLTVKVNGKKEKVFCVKKPKKIYRHRINVRFRDLDAMGHVSNNVFLVYLEEARVGFRDFVAKNNKGTLEFSSVVASHNIEYFAPIFLGEELEVEIFISHLTEKSYRFNYRILNRKTKQLKAKAYTQMVGYDYKRQIVKPLPQDFIIQMKEYIVW